MKRCILPALTAPVSSSTTSLSTTNGGQFLGNSSLDSDSGPFERLRGFIGALHSVVDEVAT